MCSNIEKRMLLFLCGCIVVRLLLVCIAKNISDDYLQYMGYLALLPAIGFMYIFATGARQTGAEVFGDKIWWNSLRPIHSTLYGLFAYSAINKNRNSWVFLALDVAIGFVAFVNQHCSNWVAEKKQQVPSKEKY